MLTLIFLPNVGMGGGGAAPAIGEWEMIPPWLKRWRIATKYV